MFELVKKMEKGRGVAFCIACGILFSILYAVLTHYSLWPDAGTGRCFSEDAITAYAPLVEHGIISDWHSDVFLASGIFCRDVIGALVGQKPSGMQVVYLYYIVSSILIFANVLLWLWRLLGRKKIYVLCSLSFAVIYVASCYKSPIGLDYFFCAPFFSALTVSLYLRKMTETRKVIFLSFILIIALSLAVSFRRNSLLVVPLVFYYAYPLLWSRIGARWKQVALLIMLSGAIYVFPSSLLKLAVPVAHEHPLAPMMASDMRIAGLFRAEKQEQMKASVRGVRPNGVIYSLSAYPPFMEHALEFNISRTEQDVAIMEKQWEQIRQDYVEEWKEHPKEMLAARGVQILYFYTEGGLPKILRDAYDALFPEMKTNSARWDRCISIGKYAFLVHFFMGIVCVIFTLFVILRYTLSEDYMRRELIYMLAISIGYTLSYLVVTPSPGNRYVMPASLINAVYLSASVLFCLSSLCSSVRRKQIRKTL